MSQCKFVRVDERRSIHARCKNDAYDDGYCSVHHGGPQNTLAVRAKEDLGEIKLKRLMMYLRKSGKMADLMREAGESIHLWDAKISELETIVSQEIA